MGVIEQIFAGYELTMRNYFNYNAITPEAVKAMIEAQTGDAGQRLSG
ncbi:MAG: hypothetical protein ACLVHY_02570 [Gemmiger sp.]